MTTRATTDQDGLFVELHTKEGVFNSSLNSFDPALVQEALPVRASGVFRKQKNMPGLWFSVSNNDFVAYESLLERDWIMIFDFDPQVVRILEQPCFLRYEREGHQVSHIPDFLIQKSSGETILANVKPSVSLEKSPFPEQRAAVETVCRFLGWQDRVLSEPDSMMTSNIRWLSAYRDEQDDFKAEATTIRSVLDQGETTIQESLSRCQEPSLAKPALMNLICSGDVALDLKAPIDDETKVWVTA